LTEIKPLRLYSPRHAPSKDDDVRLPLVIAARAIALSLCAGIASSPVGAATQTTSVNATAVKPLVITKLQDLDLGTVTLGPGVWSNASISLSQAGALSCANANLVCSGATVVASYNIQGSNKQTVRISAPNVTMVNQSDPSQTLTLVTDAPSTVLLTSSGIPGNDFSIGGSVTLNSTTAAGTYVGTFSVTVDY
jgi:hypothetical protein